MALSQARLSANIERSAGIKWGLANIMAGRDFQSLINCRQNKAKYSCLLCSLFRAHFKDTILVLICPSLDRELGLPARFFYPNFGAGLALVEVLVAPVCVD